MLKDKKMFWRSYALGLFSGIHIKRFPITKCDGNLYKFHVSSGQSGRIAKKEYLSCK